MEMFGYNFLLVTFLKICSYHATISSGSPDETQHCVSHALQIDQPACQQTHSLWCVGICGWWREGVYSLLGEYLRKIHGHFGVLAALVLLTSSILFSELRMMTNRIWVTSYEELYCYKRDRWVKGTLLYIAACLMVRFWPFSWRLFHFHYEFHSSD